MRDPMRIRKMDNPPERPEQALGWRPRFANLRDHHTLPLAQRVSLMSTYDQELGLVDARRHRPRNHHLGQRPHYVAGRANHLFRSLRGRRLGWSAMYRPAGGRRALSIPGERQAKRGCILDCRLARTVWQIHGLPSLQPRQLDMHRPSRSAVLCGNPTRAWQASIGCEFGYRSVPRRREMEMVDAACGGSRIRERGLQQRAGSDSATGIMACLGSPRTFLTNRRLL